MYRNQEEETGWLKIRIMQRFSLDFFLSHARSNSTLMKDEVFFSRAVTKSLFEPLKIRSTQKRGTNLEKIGTNLKRRLDSQIISH